VSNEVSTLSSVTWCAGNNSDIKQGKKNYRSHTKCNIVSITLNSREGGQLTSGGEKPRHPERDRERDRGGQTKERDSQYTVMASIIDVCVNRLKDRSSTVVAALFNYRRCPAEECAFEHVFTAVVSTRDDPRIEEDRRLGALGRRRIWCRRYSTCPTRLTRWHRRYMIWRGRGDGGSHIAEPQGAE